MREKNPQILNINFVQVSGWSLTDVCVGETQDRLWLWLQEPNWDLVIAHHKQESIFSLSVINLINL